MFPHNRLDHDTSIWKLIVVRPRRDTHNTVRVLQDALFDRRSGGRFLVLQCAFPGLDFPFGNGKRALPPRRECEMFWSSHE